MKKLLLKQKPTAKIGKAEVKIFVIMSYYILLGVILISALAYTHATADEVVVASQEYFICQSAGIRPDRDCGNAPEVHVHTLHNIIYTGLFLEILMPIVFLIFIIDWKGSHTCLKSKRLP